MRNVSVVLLAVGILSIFGCSSPSNPGAETDAVAAAKAWLSLVDSEKYEESWNEAAGFFRGVVPKDEWQQSMQALRKPLGKNISRELQSRQYRTSLPGAPD